LRDQKLTDIDTELAGIARIERMFGIDEGAGAALLLGLGDAMQRHGSLARAFRTIDLDDAAFGQPTNPQRDVEAERSRRDRFDLDDRPRTEPHHRTLAESALDLRERALQRLTLIHVVFFHDAKIGG